MLKTEKSILPGIFAWLVHLFTASAAILGLFTFYAIYQGDYILALWLMGISIFIDSVDGSLARFFHVKTIVPRIDGALLDNIVDYLNYVMTPAFFLLISPILPSSMKAISAGFIILASAYQFTQIDAKTHDNFFKGFPSYWNLVVFYLFIGNLHSWINFIIILILAALIFVPIKYLYLTRLDHVTQNPLLKAALIFATLLYALVTVGLLAIYPHSNLFLVIYSWFFGLLYLGISLYRTFVPMKA